MRKILQAVFLLLLFMGTIQAREKIFVVERENSALAVINHNLKTNEIKHLHNFNHAIVKFSGKYGYIITRDGYLIKFDPIKEKKLKEIKASNSAIDFTLGKKFIAVANYDNKTVEIYDKQLKLLQTIKTGSRNVGVKLYKNYLIFACMDKDQLWVMKSVNTGKKEPHFALDKKIKNIGKVPFDAVIDKNIYIVVLFNSPDIGVLNLNNMKYKKIPLKLSKKERILKIPHIGLWSVSKNRYFIPSVGNKKIYVFDHKFNFIKSIKIKGNPVFTALSPDKKWLAVSFSGKDFPFVQIINAKTLKIVRTLKFPGWILHLRWSNESHHLYFSVNTANEVVAYNTSDKNPLKWWKHFEWPVKKPSGIFLYDYKDK